MSDRACAETMVRLLECETTEQRRLLADERGSRAELEALVVHLEVSVSILPCRICLSALKSSSQSPRFAARFRFQGLAVRMYVCG